MATLRLFAAAREAAGTGAATVEGTTVAEVLSGAVQRFGPAFEAVLGSCRVWVNGDHADPAQPVGDRDEVAVLPPVSGGM
jgi:molybdopterin converting factor small subunit